MTNPVQIPDAAVQAIEKIKKIAGSFINEGSRDYPQEVCSALKNVGLELLDAVSDIPHLPLGYKVKKLEWRDHPNDGTVLTDGHTGNIYLQKAVTPWGAYFIVTDGEKYYFYHSGERYSQPYSNNYLEDIKAAAQSDFDRRVRECHVPRPDIKTIIDEIRAGTRQGFLNEGDQPEESDAELSCPYCGGSGHIDDVATKPVGVASVREQCRKAVRNAILNMRPEHRASAEICDDVIAQTFRALSAEPAQGEQWQRADSDQSVLFYTLRQDGWSKGQPSMVNDIQIHVSLNIGSKLNLSKVADTLFAVLPPAPNTEVEA